MAAMATMKLAHTKYINKGKFTSQGKGTTYQYKRKLNGKEFISTRRNKGNIANHEIQILEALQDLPGIIPIVNKLEHINTINILTPKMTSDLSHFVIYIPDPEEYTVHEIPKNILLDIFRQIIETVISMHERHICHLDLKLENIVIDNENKIYIIDFESAEKMDENGFFKTKIFGTQYYIPPNFNHKKTSLINGYAMDMYAVCTIMINSWLLQYGMKDTKNIGIIQKDTKEMIDIFKGLRKRYNEANSDLEFQEELLETIEALLLIENNELQKSKKGGYKKPRRTIHKQYTRKRYIVPSYKKSYQF
jgi:serine/threonine protein kinase